MNVLKISSLIAELMEYFQSEPSQRVYREPGLIKKLEEMAAELGSNNTKESTIKSCSEDTESNRVEALKLIPDDIIVPAIMKLFAWLVAFKDDNDKRPYQLIVEKGEIPSPFEYYAARAFHLGKKITVIKDEKNIDIQMTVELLAVSSKAFPKIDIELEISPEAQKPFSESSPDSKEQS